MMKLFCGSWLFLILILHPCFRPPRLSHLVPLCNPKSTSSFFSPIHILCLLVLFSFFLQFVSLYLWTFFIPPSVCFSTFPPFLCPQSPFDPNGDPHLLVFFPLLLVLFPTLSLPSSVSPPSFYPSPSVSCPTWLQVNSRIPAAPNVSCSLHKVLSLRNLSQSDETISNLHSLISVISQKALEMRRPTSFYWWKWMKRAQISACWQEGTLLSNLSLKMLRKMSF